MKKREIMLNDSLEQIKQICIKENEKKVTKLNLGKTKIEVAIAEATLERLSYGHLNHHNVSTNLYDRMTLKTFKKLNDLIEKYPNTFNQVVNDLQHNVNFLNVRYHTVYLMWAYGVIDSMFLSDISKHFDL